MEPAPGVGQGFFPLDEELGLLGGGLTPRLEEILVRLACWMPFAPARELLEDLMGVAVSKATTRRLTLDAGAAALAVCEQEVTRLQQEVPEAPQGADKQALSADGAFVPLVAGEWAEVKTLVIGEVTRTQRGEVCTQHLTSFSRLANAASFEEAALIETHRRGLEKATGVCAVQDGAEWLPGLVDYHCADAVRILDFAHAAEYVAAIGQAVQAAGGRLPATWLTRVLHRLKHDGPDRVLTHLAWLAAHYPSSTLQEKLSYLQKREASMHYPTYQAAGWPIGSGSVESANKLVVEARLKGAGMHWCRHNVNPVLVLRNAVCNGRWQETWQTATRQQQHGHQQLRNERTQTRCEQAVARFLNLILWSKPPTPCPPLELALRPVNRSISTTAEATAGPRRPAANHPWRRPLRTRPTQGELAKK